MKYISIKMLKSIAIESKNAMTERYFPFIFQYVKNKTLG